MGKILLEERNLLTENIPEKDRDATIDDFGKMHAAASGLHDEFFALESLYGDMDAPIFRYFQNWNDFIKQEYGKNVSLNSFQILQEIFAQTPNLTSVSTVEEFFSQEKPLAEGGFRYPEGDGKLLVDVPTWRKWKESWFCANQELIDWTGLEDCFFLNSDVIAEILNQENRCYIVKRLEDSEVDDISEEKINEFFCSQKVCHIDEDLSKGLKENAAAVFFHSIVMNSHARGGDRQGYASTIGAAVCKSNYYIELPELSAMEKDAAPEGRNNVQRKIFGIKTKECKWKFVSIDFEKGMFEFHNDNGEHLGEYWFDGSRNADAQADHDLRCVDAWKTKNG